MATANALRSVVQNLRSFFKKERISGRPWYLLNIFRRLRAATGLPRSTLCRHLSDKKLSSSVLCSRPTSRCKLDSFDCALVRRTIHECNIKKEHITVRELKQKLESKDVTVSKSTLHRTVLKMGFRFYRGGVGKRFMREREDVVCSRHRYLREVKKAREEGDIVVYVDETWVNANHCVKGEWSDCIVSETSKLFGDEKGACKFIPSGKGKRLIVLDAGCRNVGLIPGVGEVFVAQSDSGDYHTEMNHEHFFNWWKHTLLPALPGPSTIVVDNASYHSVLTDDTRSPTTATRKDDIKVWLRERRIVFTNDMVKAELLEIVKRNKPRCKYIVDELALEAGHKVLRLPPRHCELNPIELVWAKMKGHVARNNSSFKISDTMVLFEESRALITPAYWNGCEDHVINKIEKELWRIDGVREDEVVPVVISIGEADETDDEGGLISDDDESSDNDETDPDSLQDGMDTTAYERDDESECDELSIVCDLCGMRDPAECDDDDIDWVCCDACEKWMHCSCVRVKGVGDYSTFFCSKCKTIIGTSF